MAGAPMMRGSLIRARGAWSGKAADVVVLGFDDRHRRRLAMTGVHGTAFLLDLPDALTLRSGDAVQLADGRLIEVLAAPEALIEISTPDRPTLVRIAWHLGNRHLPVQIVGERLRLRHDHVIESMVEGLGGRLRVIDAPFDPEGGAYGDHGGGGHHASHGHHAHG